MKIRWIERQGAPANARRRLPGLAAEFFFLGRDLAARDNPSPGELHKFRLAAKRLRYTLELFRSCYGPALEARLDELKKVQTFLGDINDCAAAGRLAEALLPETSAHRARLDRFLQTRAAEETKGFRQYWRDQFDAPGRERRWVAYLAAATGPGRK
jgi:CHAD domain-containing protein